MNLSGMNSGKYCGICSAITVIYADILSHVCLTFVLAFNLALNLTYLGLHRHLTCIFMFHLTSYLDSAFYPALLPHSIWHSI